MVGSFGCLFHPASSDVSNYILRRRGHCSEPGGRRKTAQIRGYLNLSSTDTGFTIRDLFFGARFENKSDGTTNRGNPDMEPSIHIAGSDPLFTNSHVYGGNDATNAPSGARPMNMHSTCVGYKRQTWWMPPRIWLGGYSSTPTCKPPNPNQSP